MSYANFAKAIIAGLSLPEPVDINGFNPPNGVDRSVNPIGVTNWAGHVPNKDLLYEGNTKTVYFPDDLWAPGQEPFIYFNIRASVDDKAETWGNICLYMPPSIKVNYGGNWEELTDDPGKLKALTGIDAGEFMKSLADGKLAGGIKDQINNVQNNGDFTKFATGILGAAADTAATQAVGDAVRKANLGKRTAVNPFTSMSYKGPSLREFQFDFALYARSPSESERIRQIVTMFKMAMHPDADPVASQRYFYDFPCVFDVFLFTPRTDMMFNVRRAALTSMSVDYGAAGLPTFFNETWAPVDVRLSLSFKELQLLSRHEIAKNY